MTNRQREWPEDPQVAVRPTGTGVTISWPYLISGLGSLIIGVAVATAAYVTLKNTSDEHTSGITDLKLDVRGVNVKVDALLIDRGLNPHQVLSDAARK